MRLRCLLSVLALLLLTPAGDVLAMAYEPAIAVADPAFGFGDTVAFSGITVVVGAPGDVETGLRHDRSFADPA